MKIIRCNICNAWLASNNPLFLKEHTDNCKFTINVKHISWCIINIDGGVKAAVIPNNRGKFKILWIDKKYNYMLGRYIDAADIKRIILKNPPDYCDDDFRVE